jgi:integrase
MAKLSEKLTDKLIRECKWQTPEGKPDEYLWDGECPGFGVRKQKSGRTTFVVKYTVDGTDQQRNKRLAVWEPGMIADMRKVAKKLIGEANAGIDRIGDAEKAAKAAKQAAQVKTLGELVPVYLAVRQRGDDGWKKLRPKTLSEVTRYLTKTWAPLHGEPIDKITHKMVKARRDEIKTESGAPTANLAMAALSTFFGWAIEAEHRNGDNPTRHIRRLQQEKRKRRLADDELIDLLTCLDAHADELGDFGAIIMLLLLTGQRRQEIGGLEWSEIPAGKRQIELPGERTKNHVEHIVPLSAPAMAILEGGARDGRWVFGGNSRGFVRWSQSKKLLDKRINELRARRGAEPMAPWTVHHIRHTVSTNLAESRERVTKKPGGLELREYYSFAKPHIREAILNHVLRGVAGDYNHAEYLHEKRDALEQWATHLLALPSAAKQTSGENSGETGDQLVSGTRS